MNQHDYWYWPDQVKTRRQVAAEYGISRRTFYNWLKDSQIKLSQRKLITPKELEQIYATFGRPRKKTRRRPW